MIEHIVLAGLNFLLDRSPWAAQRLKPFAGREAQLIAPPAMVEFRIDPEGKLEPAVHGMADVEIRLPAGAAFLALRGPEAVMGGARISGSADLAEALGFVFRHLDWDAEEDLARVFGDIAAHRLAGVGRSFLGWQADAATRLAENAAEYLKHENRVLVARSELRDFSERLDELRSAVARLEMRLSGLTQAKSRH